MCGLYGWITKDNNEELNAEQKIRLTVNLAWRSTTRGMDSWGVLTSKNIWHRLGLFSTSSLSEKKNKKLTQDVMSSKLLLGHTRMASQGQILLRNCHPFQCQNLVLFHNGSFDASKFIKETGILPKGDTDSEAFLTWVVSSGIEPVDLLNVPEISASIHNDAFVIVDTKKDIVWFCCLGRSLFYTSSPFVYSSEEVITQNSFKQALWRKASKIEKLPSFSISKFEKGKLEIIKEVQNPPYAESWLGPWGDGIDKWGYAGKYGQKV